MKINILCPGSSLLRFSAEAVRADMTIGVNRAASLVAVDVWACGDHPCYKDWHHTIISCPRLFTDPHSADYIDQYLTTWRGEVERFDDFDPQLPGIDWRFLTFTAAIGYAICHGATRIHCYGCDWAGVKDWDGVEAGMSRTDDRWAAERGLFNLIRDAIQPRGIVLERCI